MEISMKKREKFYSGEVSVILGWSGSEGLLGPGNTGCLPVSLLGHRQEEV
jgi:hypothetical protein